MEAENAPTPVAKPVPGPPSKPKNKWVPKNSQSTLKFGSPTAVKKEPELPVVKSEPAPEAPVKAEEPAVKEEPKTNGVEKSPKKKKKKSKGSDADGEKKPKKKKKSKGSDTEGEKKHKHKKKHKDEDPERAIKKERKRMMKEAIKEQKRKEKKRKRSAFIEDEAGKKNKKKHSDDEKEVPTSEDELSSDGKEFLSTHPDDEESSMAEGETTSSDESDEESGSEGEKEERRQSKRLAYDSAKDIKHGDGEGEAAEAAEMEKEIDAAGNGVGSKATQNKGKDKKKDKEEEKKTRKRGGKVCGYCDKDIPEKWKQDRGENTGTGTTWVYFHEQCFDPFLEDSKRLRAEGKKPSTAKGKKKKDDKKDERKEKLKEMSTEEKPKKAEAKAKEAKPKTKEEKRGAGGEPAAKKAKPGPNITEAMEAFSKARENYDGWLDLIIEVVANGIDLNKQAEDMDKFLSEWRIMELAMKEIEDGKRERHNLPKWPFTQGLQISFLLFHIMGNDHSYKKLFSALRRRAAAAKSEVKPVGTIS